VNSCRHRLAVTLSLVGQIGLTQHGFGGPSRCAGLGFRRAGCARRTRSRGRVGHLLNPGAARPGGRCVELYVARPCVIRTCLPPRCATVRSGPTGSTRAGRCCLEGVLLLRLGAGEQADLDEIQRADEPITDTEAVGLDDASRSRTAQWCSSRTSAAPESFGMSARTSQYCSSENTVAPSVAASAPARARAAIPSSPSKPSPIRAPILLPSSIASSCFPAIAPVPR
jgi:hypothetical protein